MRRYQNPDGSLTSAGKKRYSVNSDGSLKKLSRSERKNARKLEKKKSENLEKARKAKAEKAEHNKAKKEAIQSGNAETISKYFNELTPKEMEKAMSRIDIRQKFDAALNDQAKNVSSGKRKADSIMSKVSMITNYSEKLIGFYNVTARVNNAFNTETYLPTIGGKDSKEWAGSRKAEKDKADREAAEKARSAKEKKEKQRVLNLGSAEDVLKYARKHGNVSSDELSKVISRINSEEQLRTIADDDRKRKGK